MIGGMHTTRMRALPMRASVPAMGPWVPTAAMHLVFLAVAAGLCLLVLDTPFWLAVGLLLAITGTFVPNLVHKEWVILLLGLSQLRREPSVSDPTFYLLLAAVHLLHVMCSFALRMPWNGRIQTIAFVRPLQRFVIMQLGVQSVAVGALFAFRSGPGRVPGLSVFAAAFLGIAAAVLARGMRHACIATDTTRN